jgi:hypothetical protein
MYTNFLTSNHAMLYLLCLNVIFFTYIIELFHKYYEKMVQTHQIIEQETTMTYMQADRNPCRSWGQAHKCLL